MKNLKLIYLIPALMVLGWGCGGEKTPKETTDSEIVELSDSAMAAPLAINYCSYIINDSIAAVLYSTRGDYSRNYAITSMSTPTGLQMPNNAPVLYSEANPNLDFSLMFKLNSLTLASSNATAKFIENSNVLVIQLDAITGTTNESYHKISGNIKDFYSGQTEIKSVVAIIRYPNGTGKYQYNFCTNVLDLCTSYNMNPIALNNFSLTSVQYNHNVTATDAPHIYAHTDQSQDKIEYLDLLIPVAPGYEIRTGQYSCVSTDNGTKNKLTISATIDSNTNQTKSLIYSFNGLISTIFTGTGNVEEIEIIVTNSSTTKVKRVKIRVQSTNNLGLVPTPSSY